MLHKTTRKYYGGFKFLKPFTKIFRRKSGSANITSKPTANNLMKKRRNPHRFAGPLTSSSLPITSGSRTDLHIEPSKKTSTYNHAQMMREMFGNTYETNLGLKEPSLNLSSIYKGKGSTGSNSPIINDSTSSSGTLTTSSTFVKKENPSNSGSGTMVTRVNAGNSGTFVNKQNPSNNGSGTMITSTNPTNSKSSYNLSELVKQSQNAQKEKLKKLQEKYPLAYNLIHGYGPRSNIFIGQFMSEKTSNKRYSSANVEAIRQNIDEQIYAEEEKRLRKNYNNTSKKYGSSLYTQYIKGKPQTENTKKILNIITQLKSARKQGYRNINNIIANLPEHVRETFPQY